MPQWATIVVQHGENHLVMGDLSQKRGSETSESTLTNVGASVEIRSLIGRQTNDDSHVFHRASPATPNAFIHVSMPEVWAYVWISASA